MFTGTVITIGVVVVLDAAVKIQCRTARSRTARQESTVILQANTICKDGKMPQAHVGSTLFSYRSKYRRRSSAVQDSVTKSISTRNTKQKKRRRTSDALHVPANDGGLAALWERSEEPHRTTSAVDSSTKVSSKIRAMIIIARLGVHDKATSSRSKRIANAFVSGIGISGMFAALVGALFGTWLDETRRDSAQEGYMFVFWDKSDPFEDEGEEREEYYAPMRESGIFLFCD